MASLTKADKYLASIAMQMLVVETPHFYSIEQLQEIDALATKVRANLGRERLTNDELVTSALKVMRFLGEEEGE